MTSIRLGLGLALCSLGVILLLQGPAAGAADTGVYIEVKESESPGAPVVERFRLYGSSHALVIGIDQYGSGWPRLSNGVKDAREVASALKQRGFEVTFLENVTGDDLRRALTRFFVINGSDPDARLFVWFAGHGHTQDGQGYLVPADAGAPGTPEFLLRALPMWDFGSLVKLAKAKHAMAIFDSCFAGTIFNVQRSRPPAAITQATMKLVRQFLTSGDAEQQVSDDGAFRRLFIDALSGEEQADANRDGYLTGTELGLYLGNRVTNLTRGQQTPRSGKLRDPGFDRGDFVFVLPKKQAALAAAVQQETQTDRAPAPSGPSRQTLELTFWDAIKDSADPADYKDFLARFPEGTFAGLAERRLALLGEQQQAALPPAEEPAPEFEVEEMEAPYRVTTRANVRAGPATRFDKIDTLASGQEVTVTGKVKGANWFRIAFGEGGEGFIFGQLLQDEASYQAEALRKAAAAVASSAQAASSAPSETQVAVGSYPRKPGEVFRDCDICPEMVVIPAGSFTMGSPASEPWRDTDEGPRHGVSIRAFGLGKYEVAFAEWDACVSAGGCNGYRPDDEGWGRGARPVINVSWKDAQSYVKWLSRETGKSYRLPSEAEWEYATRAGTTTTFSFGRTIAPDQAHYDGTSIYDGWPPDPLAPPRFAIEAKTATIGFYPANGFGLHDMHGNVWEWIEDCWHESYAGAPTNGSAWTAGGNCDSRVLRGGSGGDRPGNLRSAVRNAGGTGVRNFVLILIGFRVARILDR